MHAGEIVVHEIDRQRVNVVLNFLGKRIGQSREAPHTHPAPGVLYQSTELLTRQYVQERPLPP